MTSKDDEEFQRARANQLELADKLVSLLPKGSSYLVITEDGLINSFDKPPSEVLALALIGACGDDPQTAQLAILKEWFEYVRYQKRQKLQ